MYVNLVWWESLSSFFTRKLPCFLIVRRCGPIDEASWPLYVHTYIHTGARSSASSRQTTWGPKRSRSLTCVCVRFLLLVAASPSPTGCFLFFLPPLHSRLAPNARPIFTSRTQPGKRSAQYNRCNFSRVFSLAFSRARPIEWKYFSRVFSLAFPGLDQ